MEEEKKVKACFLRYRVQQKPMEPMASIIFMPTMI